MAEDADRLSARVDALEEKLAFQDETIEALNQTITAQWKEIDALKRELSRALERLDDVAAGHAPVDRPPPHY